MKRLADFRLATVCPICLTSTLTSHAHLKVHFFLNNVKIDIKYHVCSRHCVKTLYSIYIPTCAWRLVGLSSLLLHQDAVVSARLQVRILLLST